MMRLVPAQFTPHIAKLSDLRTPRPCDGVLSFQAAGAGAENGSQHSVHGCSSSATWIGADGVTFEEPNSGGGSDVVYDVGRRRLGGRNHAYSGRRRSRMTHKRSEWASPRMLPVDQLAAEAGRDVLWHQPPMALRRQVRSPRQRRLDLSIS